jgi:hypothetical protein
MVLLMVVYIAKIYADCLYRFSLDCQTASTDVYTSHSLGIHACALGSVRMAIFVRTVGSRGKVIELRKRIRADGLASLLPVRRAHFTVLVLPMTLHQHSVHHNKEKKSTYGELERLHETQSLLDRPSDGQVVHRDLPTGHGTQSAIACRERRETHT